MSVSIYNPDYHPERLIDIMKDGKSKVQACADFGISLSTHEKWVAAHPEYKEAYVMARIMCQAWWEEELRKGCIGKTSFFNSNSIAFAMKSRFPEDYREKPPEQPVNNIFLSLTDSQLKNLAISKAKTSGLLEELMSGTVFEGEVENVEAIPE